jgi:hypothetical protein
LPNQLRIAMTALGGFHQPARENIARFRSRSHALL